MPTFHSKISPLVLSQSWPTSDPMFSFDCYLWTCGQPRVTNRARERGVSSALPEELCWKVQFGNVWKDHMNVQWAAALKLGCDLHVAIKLHHPDRETWTFPVKRASYLIFWSLNSFSQWVVAWLRSNARAKCVLGSICFSLKGFIGLLFSVLIIFYVFMQNNVFYIVFMS